MYRRRDAVCLKYTADNGVCVPFFVYDRFDLKMLIISAVLQIVNAQNCYCICRERRGRYRISFPDRSEKQFSETVCAVLY